MRGQLPTPRFRGASAALRPGCGRAPASCIRLFRRLWLRRVLALRRFLERGRPHRHALRVGPGKRPAAAPFSPAPPPVRARHCLLRSHAAFCQVRALTLRPADRCALFDRGSTARVRTRCGRPRHLRRLFSGKVPAAAPPSGAAPFPATFRRSDALASAPLAPAKTIVMYFSAPARRAAAEPTHTVSFFASAPFQKP